MQLEDYPPALSATQVAEILGISRVHAWRLINSGEIPSFRLGRLNRVPRAAIEHLLLHGTMAGFPPVRSEDDPHAEAPPEEEQQS